MDIIYHSKSLVIYFVGSLFLWIALFATCNPVPTDIKREFSNIPDRVDFNLHVRPILSDRCYSCHGPDQNKREASLRLDVEGNATSILPSGHVAFSAKRVNRSEAIQRIMSDDTELIMPPIESNLFLTNREKAILVKWVEQGAEWKKHWSYLPIQDVPVPESKNNWTQFNEIDHFIQNKLEEKELEPNPEADKSLLLRRVSMDLTGLPPSLDELDRFQENKDPNAFTQQVDRLLESPHYGERIAMEWMDVSRYADSHGLHADGWRYMHPWRDWVIKSFNQNKPYDEFILEQLAGDLLPKATRDQKLATAFHRNHSMTAEGGAIDEEWRLEYVFDRVNTTATAFLGMTLECARCHDHKFDPLAQKDFYALGAFFNNIKEVGMTGDDGNFGPSLLLPSSEQELALSKISEKIKIEQEKKKLLVTEIEAIQKLINPKPPKDFAIYLPLNRQGGSKDRIVDNNKNTRSSEGLEFISERNKTFANFDDQYDDLFIQKKGLYEIEDEFSFAIWIKTNQQGPIKTQTIVGNSGEKNTFWRGWDFYLDENNRLNVRLIHSLPHNYIHLQSAKQITLNEWTHVGFSYDGLADADGIRIYINGTKQPGVVQYNKLYKSIHPVASGHHKKTDRALNIGQSGRAFSGEYGIFLGQMDDLYLFNRELTNIEFRLLFDSTKDSENLQELNQHRISSHPKIQSIEKSMRQLVAEKTKIYEEIEEVMVLEEMPEPRTMHLLNRGQYDQPLEEVKPDIPKALGEFPDDFTRDRLGLAKWIIQDENPLTARVLVNRYWQMIFGKGLVSTPEDFGSQGRLPTHPQLLDWLASYFVDSGWDLKALLRKIVTSYTYRQQTLKSSAQMEQDPLNDYLWRYPGDRYPAEFIRDNALSASGLLVKDIGGKSVKPYQPDGLWIELGNFSHILLNYKKDTLDDLYRRTLYTFIRRTSPPPAMTVFDVPTRDVCKVKRELTSTPLQSLVLLNDPTYIEASRVLAHKVIRTKNTVKEQIEDAFRSLTSRKPELEELEILENLYKDLKKSYITDPSKAKKLMKVGDWKFKDPINYPETAAMTMVVNTILNHDDTFHRR